MKNPSYDASEVFRGIDQFDNRIVAYVDVMGIGDRMRNANSPKELQLFTTLMYMYCNQPFAEGKIMTTIFSDCMYIVAEPRYIMELISLISNFAYNLLVNRMLMISKKENGDIESKCDFDCLKLRGGITYGKVLVLDEYARRKGISFNSNIVLGPAVIKAYELESQRAIFPRVIVDDSFRSLLEKSHIKCDECYLVKDENDEVYYLDFIKYMFKGNGLPKVFGIGCLEYVKLELEIATEKGNERLKEKLKWYINYLESRIGKE